ncbi:MAG: hypothetical protein KC421_12030, partial [Anaerolineales bacterium]|nr:hypothetical protein [Anaerolineales bacterium]
MNFHLLNVLVITAVFLSGCLLPILYKRAVAAQLSLGLALVGSVLGAWWTGSVLVSKQPISVTIISLQTEWFAAGSHGIELPPLSWSLHLDNLSAFYGFLITAFAAVVAVYSFGALQAAHYQQQRGRIVAAFNLFVWSTLMVVLVSDLFSLIVVLEIMTLSFGFLTLYKHTLYQDSTRSVTEQQAYLAALAPKTYLIISHVSTAFLVVPLLLLAINAGGVSLDLIAAHKAALSQSAASVIFLLALVGAGIRAGLTPFHFWVPIVHSTSPTTIDAFSLGMGIKVPIYLMVRFFFQFLQPQPWWGYLLLLLAAITALVNVWFAIVSHDLKTALAYHSIENVGIIVAGLGVALIFAARRQEDAAFFVSLALAASFYHTVNHAVFKGLLYLATGAIDNLTGQVVRFDKLGGLMKLYPWTAVVFIVGAISISGFPPFNGFVSEWLTVQALLKGGYLLRAEPFKLGILLVGLVGLAAAFALTAFCFYK